MQAIFADALAISADTDFASLEYQGIKEWDSVGHMRLVGAIEDAFDIMLETDDVIDMSSYVRAKEILAKYDIEFDQP